MAQYAQALSGCRAAEFADLFVPETGYFASSFHMVGRERLIALVESERQCVAPTGKTQATRPGRSGGTGGRARSNGRRRRISGRIREDDPGLAVRVPRRVTETSHFGTAAIFPANFRLQPHYPIQ